MLMLVGVTAIVTAAVRGIVTAAVTAAVTALVGVSDALVFLVVIRRMVRLRVIVVIMDLS